MAEYILGVEIGGTKLQLGIGTPEGEIVATQQGGVDPALGGEGIREWLKNEIPAFIAAARDKFGEVIALGCGFGGPMDTVKGRVLRSIQIEGWQDFPIRDWFEAAFKLPTSVDNDFERGCLGGIPPRFRPRLPAIFLYQHRQRRGGWVRV